MPRKRKMQEPRAVSDAPNATDSIPINESGWGSHVGGLVESIKQANAGVLMEAASERVTIEIEAGSIDLGPDRIINFADAGRLIGKPRQRVWQWAQDGLIPTVRNGASQGIRLSSFVQLYHVSIGLFLASEQAQDVVTNAMLSPNVTNVTNVPQR